MNIFFEAFNLLMPPSCLICRRRIANGRICHRCIPDMKERGHFCINCQTPLFDQKIICQPCRIFPPVYRHMRFIWDYHRKNVPEFINSMKYRPSLSLCKIAGQIAAKHIKTAFPGTDWDLVIPVPSSLQSRRQRMFNQCAVIAAQIFPKCGLPAVLSFNALLHKGYNFTQASLSHAERINNVKKSYYARPEKVKNKTVLLIDDVITTGATSNYAVSALLEAGADSVDIYALARSEVWNEHRSRFNKLIRTGGLQAAQGLH